MCRVEGRKTETRVARLWRVLKEVGNLPFRIEELPQSHLFSGCCSEDVVGRFHHSSSNTCSIRESSGSMEDLDGADGCCATNICCWFSSIARSWSCMLASCSSIRVSRVAVLLVPWLNALRNSPTVLGTLCAPFREMMPNTSWRVFPLSSSCLRRNGLASFDCGGT